MVHQLVKYEPGKPFSLFPEKVENARCETDKNPLKTSGRRSKIKTK